MFATSRRAFLGTAAFAPFATTPRLAMAQEPATPSGEVDMFAYMVRTFGQPKYADRIGPDEARANMQRVHR
jgi:hypothetical protein